MNVSAVVLKSRSSKYSALRSISFGSPSTGVRFRFPGAATETVPPAPIAIASLSRPTECIVFIPLTPAPRARTDAADAPERAATLVSFSVGKGHTDAQSWPVFPVSCRSRPPRKHVADFDALWRCRNPLLRFAADMGGRRISSASRLSLSPIGCDPLSPPVAEWRGRFHGDLGDPDGGRNVGLHVGFRCRGM